MVSVACLLYLKGLRLGRWTSSFPLNQYKIFMANMVPSIFLPSLLPVSISAFGQVVTYLLERLYESREISPWYLDVAHRAGGNTSRNRIAGLSIH